MFNIAICDDNNIICSKLEKVILEYTQKNNISAIIEVFWSGEKLIEFIKNEHSFDLILLDIQLGSTTGIEVGRIIRNKFKDYTSKILLISGDFEYENQIFDVLPFNFLEKPIDDEKLVNCVKLALEIHLRDGGFLNYKTNYVTKTVKYTDILYFERTLRKIKLVTHTYDDTFNSSITKLKDELPNNFILANSSVIVNYDYIKSINSHELVMNDGTKIQISQSNYKKIRKLQVDNLKEKQDVSL